MLPLGQSGPELRIVEIDGRPELLQRRLLHALDLAVEVRRARPDGAELDAPGPQPVLDLVGEEFLATVGLDALDRDRYLLDELIEKRQGRLRRWAGEEANHLITRAIVDRRVLVEPRSDLADVHLDAVAGDRPRIALPTLSHQPRPLQPVQPVPAESLVDRVDRQAEAVQPDQLVPEALDAQLAVAPQRENALLLARKHPAPGRTERTPAAIHETCRRCHISPPPLPERRPRHAASAAGHARISRPLVHPHPDQPRRRRHVVLPAPLTERYYRSSPSAAGETMSANFTPDQCVPS